MARCAAFMLVCEVARALVAGPRAPAPRVGALKTATATPGASYLDSLDTCEMTDFQTADCHDDAPPFAKVLAANRAEIAVRIMRVRPASRGSARRLSSLRHQTLVGARPRS